MNKTTTTGAGIKITLTAFANIFTAGIEKRSQRQNGHKKNECNNNNNSNSINNNRCNITDNNELTFETDANDTSSNLQQDKQQQQQQQQLQRGTMKTTNKIIPTTMPMILPPPLSSPLTRLHCIFLIILLLLLTSSISFVYSVSNVRATTTTTTTTTPSTTTITASTSHIVPVEGMDITDRLRYARSAIYANDYSSQLSSSSSSSHSKSSAIPATNEDKTTIDKNNHERYLAGLGFRTKLKPQQFYKTSRNSTSISRGNILESTAKRNELTSFDLVTGPRDDICKEHCTCAKLRNAFTTVSCDYQKNPNLNPIFGANFKVPEDTTGITIKLASNTNFRLERGFFLNNKVNSFSIDGTFNEREQVEITTEAFRGNYGPYPDIYITNVYSVVIRAKAFSGNCKFSVRNSNDLILFPDAFQNASIHGVFVGINDLRIEEKAFNSAQAKLRIQSSHIDNIYRFEASLREIRFVNCTIGTINGGTFDVITINSIAFDECRIDVIKARAITEKLYSEHVSITGAVIGTIESEAIYGSGIAELILTKNKIDTIHENAIHVTAINATITNNHIKHLGNNWLRVKDWSNIIVSRNRFGIFNGMMLEETKHPVTCRFESNSLTQALPGSLNITNRYCVLREISVNIPCKCNLDWLQELSARDLRSEVYCTIDDKLSFCFNATTFNTLKYLNEVCDDTKTVIDCGKNINLKKINGVFFTPEELERRDQRIPKLIFIVGGSLALLVLAIIAVVTALRCCRRSLKDVSGSGQSTNSVTVLNQSDHLHEFSQDDRHVIHQTLSIIQKRYTDIYKPINDRIQLLLQNNLSDKKCVKIVSSIVDLLNQVEQTGDDFVSFNRILTQHLQPQAPTAPPADPIYAEPSLNASDDGCYTTNILVPLAAGQSNTLDSVSAGGVINGLSEHIYAEPNCAQQPLLRNEYASPADGNMDNMDLYTEPINERDSNHSMTEQITGIGAVMHLPQYAKPTMPKRNQKLPSIPNESTTTQTTTTKAQTPIAASLFHHKRNNPSNKQQMNSSIDPSNSPSRRLSNIPQMTSNYRKFYNNPSSSTPNSTRRNLHLTALPGYSTPDGKRKIFPNQSTTTKTTLAAPEFDECELDMRGATALPPSSDSGSNHSGGSNETVKIDDVIQYADA